MKLCQNLTKYFFLLSIIFLKHTYSASLDGTSSIVYKNYHHVFYNGQEAQGYVRMNEGFTVRHGATVILDTVISVSGGIDLRDTAEIQLLKDLKLDTCVSLSSGGSIKGRGRALILSGTLSIPSSKVIYISGDTIIEGNGNTLILDDYAQIFVDNNTTLTLRNLILKSTKNNEFSPCLKIGGDQGKIAFENVRIFFANDAVITHGQLYFHKDVIFGGTSALIYNSPVASYIAPASRLLFDIGTTFSFAPTTTTDHLLILQDQTSTLALNGSSLLTTISGMRLTKGNLHLSNKVVLKSNTGLGNLSTLSTLTSVAYGNSSHIYRLEWDPQGKFLALGGSSPASGAGGFANTDELRVYSFDGQNLTPIDSKDYGTEIQALAWRPDGKFVAIGGTGAAAVGGFSNTQGFRVYSFDGSVLTPIKSVPYGTTIKFIDWNPDGSIVAMCGTGPASGGGFSNTDEIRLYTFNGAALVALTSINYGFNVEAIHWSYDGKYLAVGGQNAGAVGGFANTNEVRIYSFNGSTLTPVTSQAYGNRVNSVRWSPDGKTLAIAGETPGLVGGFANTDKVRIYSFNGSALAPVTSQAYGTSALSLNWSPDGRILAVGGNGPTSGAGGFSNTDELRIYLFNGSSLVPITSKQISDGATGSVDAITWHPNNRIIVIGGNAPVINPSGGFNNTDEVRLYSTNYTTSTNPQAYSRSLVFGNSNLGSSFNLNVEVLGNAQVTVDGIVNDDSV